MQDWVLITAPLAAVLYFLAFQDHSENCFLGSALRSSRSTAARTTHQLPLLPPVLQPPRYVKSRVSVSLYPRKRPFAALPRNDAMGHVWTAPAVQEESDVLRSVRVQPCIRPVFEWRTSLHCDAAAVAAGPDVIRWSGPKQKHALNYRVAHHGFSRSTVSTVRINVVITPAVRERTDATSSCRRQTPHAATVSAGAR